MTDRIKQWLWKERRVIIRQTVILLCALALGIGYSCFQANSYTPSLSGDIRLLAADESTVFLALSDKGNNNLVHMDYKGNLLNYTHTDSNQTFQHITVDKDTAYAILNTHEQGRLRQTLVSLSLRHPSMRPKLLVALTENIIWQELTLVFGNEGEQELLLTGIDGELGGHFLRWSPDTEKCQTDSILKGKALLALKYIQVDSSDGYIWINQKKEVGADGFWSSNPRSIPAQMPHRIFTSGNHYFLSDSETGNIYELQANGAAVPYRRGQDKIGDTGYRYNQLKDYAGYSDKSGKAHIIGLSNGQKGSAIIYDGGAVKQLYCGPLRLLMIWTNGWRATIVFWLLLLLFGVVKRNLLFSPRLVVRLALCELAVAAMLLGWATFVQYRSFQDTMIEDARQKLQLVGASLAGSLSRSNQMSGDQVSLLVATLQQQLGKALEGEEHRYTISVVWGSPAKPSILYDSVVPEGYPVEKVKSIHYLSTVSSVLDSGKSQLVVVQTNGYTDYLYVQAFKQGEEDGCVTVAQPEEMVLVGRTSFLQRLIPILVACPLLFAALILITRRLLRPLEVVQKALEEFYACGGGNQMDLSSMAHTEIYEVGRVFNQLSVQARTQMNTLSRINGAYARLVPNHLVEMLRKNDVVALAPGECVAVRGALLMLAPYQPARDAMALQRMANPAATHIAAHSGILTDYDEGLGSLTALFSHAEQALTCAHDCLTAYESDGQQVLAAVFTGDTELGVFGSEDLLLPVAVSRESYRRQAVLALLRDFGAVLVCDSESKCGNSRLLGWDRGQPYYEDTAVRSPEWVAQWCEASGLWKSAMELYHLQNFTEAMRNFAKVLRLMPKDAATRWYLFRCEALRDGVALPADTGLLYHWKEGGDGGG